MRSSSDGTEGAKGPAPSVSFVPSDALRLRAENAFWNGAGDYSAAPPRLFATDTDPCLYENLATGLMCRRYGAGEVAAFFASWEGDYRADRLDEVAWLVLERGAYLAEREERPALDGLRARFLSGLSPAEREASERIERLGKSELGALPEAQAAIRALQKSLLGFDGTIVRAPAPSLHLGVSLLSYAGRKAGRDREKGFFIRSALDPERERDGGAQRGRRGKASSHERRAARREAADRAYVESRFGPLACAKDELAGLERRVCTGAHAGCRLWVADAAHGPGPADNRELRELAAQADEQFRENRAFYETRRGTYDGIVEKLAFHLRDSLASASYRKERRHRSGSLDAGAAWRAEVLGDDHVFCRRVPTTSADVSLDLLLDASGSRSDEQAQIAAQAYIVARAFQLCGAPVRVSAYATLRNHTVLRFFGDYGSSAGLNSVFRYYASGFNRDGLALSALGDIIENGLGPLKASRARNRILIVLTDAAPMDENGYVGRPAVNDAAMRVRALSDAGLRVAALYTGSDDFVSDARAIYGTSFLRVQHVEQMAGGILAFFDDMLD